MSQITYVRTRERDLHEPPNRERGARYWKRVELLNDNWFYLHTVERLGSGEFTTRKVIVADFWEALKVLQQTSTESVRLYACVHSPLQLREGLAFQEVEEAHRLDSNGGVLMRFSSGLLMAWSSAGATAKRGIELLEKVYPVRP